MKFMSSRLPRFSRKSWYFFLTIFFITLGIIFRFINIDRKVFWLDEVFTSFNISGYLLNEMLQNLNINYISQGKLISISELQQYQGVNPSKTIIDTAKSILTDFPDNTPLYFLSLRLWCQIFGNSVTIIRGFSVFFSLISLLCLYFLCQKLFSSKFVGLTAVALMAVSPFFLLYSQEARFYSFWTVTILLSYIALLQALQNNNLKTWAIYGLAVSVTFYTHILSVFVLLSQVIYLLIREKFKFTATIQRFLLSILLSILGFLPWAILIFLNSSQKLFQALKMGAVENKNRDFLGLVRDLILNIGRNFTQVFIDFQDNGIFYPLIMVFIVSIIAYSLYILLKKNTNIGLLIGTLLIVTPGGMFLRDLIFSSAMRSNISRYFIPAYLAAIISLAFLFTDKIYSEKNNHKNINEQKQQAYSSRIWGVLLTSILFVSSLSCIGILPQKTWWIKGDVGITEVSEIINNSRQPLVIMHPLHVERFAIFSLMQSLNPKIKFIILNEKLNHAYIPDGYSDYYLFFPTAYGSPEISNIALQKAFPFKLANILRYKSPGGQDLPLLKFEKL